MIKEILKGRFPWRRNVEQVAPSPLLLPESGRSSREQSFTGALDGIMNYYGTVNPYVPVETLKFLTLLAVFNPDVSQAVKNIRTMVNNGHSLIITDKNESRARVAINRLNEKAYTWYRRSAGIDGLFQAYSTQLAVSNAISSEDIVAPDGKGVQGIVLVPTFSIRFKYENNDYVPCQQVSVMVREAQDGLIRLNVNTYCYYAAQTLENSPYAIPEMVSAVGPISIQREMFKNLSFAVKKLGLLGLNIVKVRPLQRRPGESEAQWQARNQEYINSVAGSIRDNFSEGVLVVPDDQDFQNFPLVMNAAGTKDLVQLNEEQVFSGMDMDPAMGGRTYSTTETYAGVVFRRLQAKAATYQRLIKRRQEKTARLDLQLARIEVDNISVRFNEQESLKPNIDELAESYRINNILKKVKAGMLSPDEAAQEAGYSSWYDEELLKVLTEGGASTKEFVWNSRSQQYELKRNLIDADKIKSQKEHEGDKRAEDAAKKLRYWATEYLKKVLPYFSKLKEDVAEFAINYVIEELKRTGSVDVEEFRDKVKEYVREHPDYAEISKNESWMQTVGAAAVILDASRYFKTVDFSCFDVKPDFEFRFGEPDRLAGEMLSRIDRFYFSKFVDNAGYGSQVRSFLASFLDRNEAGDGLWSDAVTKEFVRLFGDAFSTDIEIHMNRIINSSVARLQNFSHLSQLNDAGFAEAEIEEVIDEQTCAVCVAMHGRRFPVAPVWKLVEDKFIRASSMDSALDFIKNSGINSVEDAGLDMSELIGQGRGFPTYHPECRGRVKAVFKR